MIHFSLIVHVGSLYLGSDSNKVNAGSTIAFHVYSDEADLIGQEPAASNALERRHAHLYVARCYPSNLPENPSPSPSGTPVLNNHPLLPTEDPLTWDTYPGQNEEWQNANDDQNQCLQRPAPTKRRAEGAPKDGRKSKESLPDANRRNERTLPLRIIQVHTLASSLTTLWCMLGSRQEPFSLVQGKVFLGCSSWVHLWQKQFWVHKQAFSSFGDGDVHAGFVPSAGCLRRFYDNLSIFLQLPTYVAQIIKSLGRVSSTLPVPYTSYGHE
ncbi:hypothetical protein DFJ58DRAFT_843326 [Suillus subalutaceus]|uniref:uncharacterized protein n=1 Tax=Suillus subalutaceus TaxID=48586 RepID=UPI001B879856|nr:uncharacterized protein DFJ58DRAFT_843326 [Suillus subalutaceus]KAG1847009.1 hypothetical protein DFJ58DRAFT_843326 [Suillus subalutaceus]